MVRNDEVVAAWALVDTATNELAARVQALIDQINQTAAEGLTGPQTDAVLANLAGLVTTLTGMGSNPGVPIPPPGNAPTPLPGPFASGAGSPGSGPGSPPGGHGR